MTGDIGAASGSGRTLGVIFTGQGFDVAQFRDFDARLERHGVLGTCYEATFGRQRPSAASCDFSRNEDSVLALLLSAFDAHRQHAGLRAQASIVSGYSVGFYLALWYAGILDETSVAQLLFERCRVMNAAASTSPSIMTVVLGLPISKIEQMIAEFPVAPGEVLCISNENAPGNVTIGGHREGVLRFGEFAAQHGAYKVVPLTTSGAWHTPLMLPAAEALDGTLRVTAFGPGEIPLIENVAAVSFPQAHEARVELLKKHLWQPVRWTQCIKAMIAQGVAEFVELTDFDMLTKLGPGISRRVAFRSAGRSV